MYKLKTGDKGVIRLADGASIPEVLGNRDYKEYLKWVAEGNVPQPADPEPVLPPDQKRLAEYPPLADIVMALWEKVVEGKNTEVNAIKIKIDEVKAKYPK